MFDSVIIGAGPSGLTAAIYLLRSNLKVAIVEGNMPGGQVANTATVENYPGYTKIDGVDLATNMYTQAMNLGVEYFSGYAREINRNDDGSFTVILDDEQLSGKTVIIATGMKQRHLHVPGEDDYIGKGISWCAICDGSLYRNQDVTVVGGGNSAVHESIYLSGIARKVNLIHRRDKFRADEGSVSMLKKIPNVELFLNDEIKEIQGKAGLEKLILKSGKEIETKALFEYIGFLPNSEIAKRFGIVNKEGFIDVDENCLTKIAGIYAVGDIASKNIRQIVTAVNDGAIAALHAVRYCRE